MPKHLKRKPSKCSGLDVAFFFLLPFKSFFTVNHIPKEDILVRPLFAACLKKGRKVETILKGIYYELMTLIYERAPSKYSWHLRLSQYEVVAK